MAKLEIMVDNSDSDPLSINEYVEIFGENLVISWIQSGIIMDYDYIKDKFKK